MIPVGRKKQPSAPDVASLLAARGPVRPDGAWAEQARAAVVAMGPREFGAFARQLLSGEGGTGLDKARARIVWIAGALARSSKALEGFADTAETDARSGDRYPRM